MRKFLAFLAAAALSTPALSAVSYVQEFASSGSIPTSNGTAITVASGSQMICEVGVHATGTISQTGSLTTLAAVSVSGSTNFNDGVSSSYAVWDNLSSTSGSQTFSVTAPSGSFVNTLQFCMNFSGAVSLKNPTYATVAAPGTGAGAISGSAISVASTDGLLVCVWDASWNDTVPTVNGPGSSTTINTYGGSGCWAWAGTGGSMTPTFTAATGTGSDTFIVIQMDVSSTSSGGSCTNQGWTAAGTWAVPTAGTTSMYLQSGAKGTVPCSGSGQADSYWQKSGVFGIN